jgi:hypothetical protein
VTSRRPSQYLNHIGCVCRCFSHFLKLRRFSELVYTMVSAMSTAYHVIFGSAIGDSYLHAKFQAIEVGAKRMVATVTGNGSVDFTVRVLRQFDLRCFKCVRRPEAGRRKNTIVARLACEEFKIRAAPPAQCHSGPWRCSDAAAFHWYIVAVL